MFVSVQVEAHFYLKQPFSRWNVYPTGWWCNNHLENDGVRQWEG
jgi:hypothetical protein